jgi:hypothetical protein
MGGSRGWCSITALRGFSRIVGGVDSKRYILGLHSIAGRDPDGRATHQRFIRQLVELALYALRNLFLRSRETAAPPAYLAFAIGPEVLAIAVQELNARSDEDALREAAPLFYDGLMRIEVWCGSRKVGDIPLGAQQIPDGEPVRHSA